jgi:hypothetical protein
MTQKNKIRDSKRVSDVEGGTGGNEGNRENAITLAPLSPSTSFPCLLFGLG